MQMINVNTMGTREAAELLGISIPYMHDLIRQGRITPLGKFAHSLVLERHAVLALKKEREDARRRRPQDGRMK